MNGWEDLEKALACVRQRTDFVPEIGITLGSGLNGLAEAMDIEMKLPYGEIEGFPVSTVVGHEGSFLFGTLAGRRVMVMSGRVHLYEGYSMQKVVMPVRLMRLMGASVLLLTNAAGGVNPTFQAGDLMLLTDHISLFVPNPLAGPNLEQLGTRFPDMTAVYDPKLRSLVLRAAEKTGIPLRQGVYAQTPGPSYETPAEVRMLRALGADAVGMSTVCEAIAARHCGLRVCGISCITNLAAGMSDHPLGHAEVEEAGNRAARKFQTLVEQAVREFSAGQKESVEP